MGKSSDQGYAPLLDAAQPAPSASGGHVKAAIGASAIMLLLFGALALARESPGVGSQIAASSPTSLLEEIEEIHGYCEVAPPLAISYSWSAIDYHISKSTAFGRCNVKDGCIGVFETNPNQWHYMIAGSRSYYSDGRVLPTVECCHSTCPSGYLSYYCANPIFFKNCAMDILPFTDKATGSQIAASPPKSLLQGIQEIHGYCEVTPPLAISYAWSAIDYHISKSTAFGRCSVKDGCIGVFESNPNQWHYMIDADNTNVPNHVATVECCHSTCPSGYSSYYCANPIYFKNCGMDLPVPA